MADCYDLQLPLKRDGAFGSSLRATVCVILLVVSALARASWTSVRGSIVSSLRSNFGIRKWSHF